MKVSVLLCTARDDYSLVDLPQVHLFEPTVRSLQAQAFRDFELVVVDGLQDQRRSILRNAGFPVKHVPPKYSPYSQRGMWAVCNAVNTGLAHAKGELIVKVDDASEFDPDYLQRIWNWHTTGLFPLTLIRYLRGGGIARYDDAARRYYCARMRESRAEGDEEAMKGKQKALDTIYPEGSAIEDTRLRYMKERFVVAPWNWVYGYVAAPLKVFLELNGYDEAFDGKKSLEDVDLGIRAHNAGYGDKFILEKGLWARENLHTGTSERVVWDKGKPVVCNYAILKLHEAQGTVRANTRRFTSKDLKRLMKESQTSPCSHSKGSDYDLGEGFRYWSENIPVFDLKALQEECSSSLGLLTDSEKVVGAAI